MLLDKKEVELRKAGGYIPRWTQEEERHAALLVYLKWSYIERFGYEPYDLVERFKKLGIRIDRFEAKCAWCTLYREGIAGLPPRKCTNLCPLERVGQNCFMTMGWFSCVPTEHFYMESGNPYSCMTGKEAAGNIAALAWKEYKRFGG